MKNKLTLLASLVLAVVVFGQSSIQFRAVWDANPESDLAGYRVWLAPVGSSTFTNAVTIVVSATPQWLIPRAEWGKQIRVTAFNTQNLESLPSVTLLIPDVPRQPQNLRINKETQAQ